MLDIVQTVVHRGSELFNIAVVDPRTPRGGSLSMPNIFNLEFRYNRHDKQMLSGGGVYAVYYRGELLYIGLFTGKDRVPFASDVASQRYYKHLEALTLRGRTIGFARKNYDIVTKLDRPECPLVSTLRGTRVPCGNGAVKTYPSKVEFASDNWAAFSQIECNPLVLEGFTFVYGRANAEHFSQDITYQQVKNYLGVIESDLIRRHNPRCNVKRPGSSSERHLTVGPCRSAWATFGKLVGDQILSLGDAEAV